jgi:hypothetical protein
MPGKPADHSTAMRIFLLPMIVLGLVAGCTPMHWEKPGADQATAVRDSTECRLIARGASLPRYSEPPPDPFAGAVGPSGYVGMRAGSANMWQYSSNEIGPYALEERIHSTCMRHRGYDRAPIPEQGS